MKGRHAAEDLAFLREKGFTDTAAEIERLHEAIDEALDYLESDARVTPEQRIANARCALHEITGDPRTPEFGVAP